MILVCSQDQDLIDHTSQEWLNGALLFYPTKKSLDYENLRFCMILVCSQDKDLMNHTSQEWLNGVHEFSPTKMIFENVMF